MQDSAALRNNKSQVKNALQWQRRASITIQPSWYSVSSRLGASGSHRLSQHPMGGGVQRRGVALSSDGSLFVLVVPHLGATDYSDGTARYAGGAISFIRRRMGVGSSSETHSCLTVTASKSMAEQARSVSL